MTSSRIDLWTVIMRFVWLISQENRSSHLLLRIGACAVSTLISDFPLISPYFYHPVFLKKKALNRHVSLHFPTDQFVSEKLLCLEAVRSSDVGRHYTETIYLAPNNSDYIDLCPFGRCSIRISARLSDIFIEIFREFPQPLRRIRIGHDWFTRNAFQFIIRVSF